MPAQTGRDRKGKPVDMGEYRAFLTEIGYLVAEPEGFAIGTQNVDPEIATMAGPQLVVPVLNDRFVLNAANARWGSLYDAWYGTDALDAPPARGGGYDADRGAAVVRAGRVFLDHTFPLTGMGWNDWDGEGVPPLADAGQFAGQKPGSILLRNNGLHAEVVLDRTHPVGKDDKVARNQQIGTIGSGVDVTTMQPEYKMVFGIYGPSPKVQMRASDCFKK